jgi:hypothetical protein
MKVEPIRAPKFAALVKKYATGTTGSPTAGFSTPVLEGCDPADPLALLLTNYLLWESTPAMAADALARIARVVVDVNDMRVMLESEVRETIGEKYPFVDERASRLRATLNDIFRRQHRTSLDHLRNASRKDQRAYLEGLAEIPPFVAGRTLLVAFELPAPIVDDTTVEILHQNGVAEPTATTAEVAQWIGKTHRIEELPKVHHALSQLASEAWGAAGRNGHKIRAAYLARHAGFRAAVEAEQRRVEEARLAKEREVERQAEERRLAEIAREEERVRQKREAEEAKVRARAEREAARVAAVAERERLKAVREAERVAREKQRLKEAERRAKEAERKRLQKEAADRKAAAQREKREKKALADRLTREKAMARKLAQKAAADAKARAKAEARSKKASAAKATAKRVPAKGKPAGKMQVKSASKSASKPKSKSKSTSKSKAKAASKPSAKSTARFAAKSAAKSSVTSAARSKVGSKARAKGSAAARPPSKSARSGRAKKPSARR